MLAVIVWPAKKVESVTVKSATGALLTVIGETKLEVWPQKFWAVTFAKKVFDG